jgi:hypothetical protein
LIFSLLEAVANPGQLMGYLAEFSFQFDFALTRLREWIPGWAVLDLAAALMGQGWLLEGARR